jgi:hypothetical protein
VITIFTYQESKKPPQVVIRREHYEFKAELLSLNNYLWCLGVIIIQLRVVNLEKG